MTVFEFGSRKLEQLVNLLIAGGMLAGAAWVFAGRDRAGPGAEAIGSPAGFAFAAIATASTSTSTCWRWTACGGRREAADR